MGVRLNRIEPNLPPGAYTTFSGSAPLATHWRRASCAEMDCPGTQRGCGMCEGGWETVCDERTGTGLAQATYIRQGSGRTFAELSGGDGVTVFRFEAHQKCFADHAPHDHRVPLERPWNYAERHGDWRGYLSDPRRHSVSSFVDAFAVHQDRLAKFIERG